jgi:hypothetical protein
MSIIVVSIGFLVIFLIFSSFCVGVVLGRKIWFIIVLTGIAVAALLPAYPARFTSYGALAWMILSAASTASTLPFLALGRREETFNLYLGNLADNTFFGKSKSRS